MLGRLRYIVSFQLWFSRQPAHNIFDVDLTDTVFALHIGTSAKRTKKTSQGNIEAIARWSPLKSGLKPTTLNVAIRGRTECMRHVFTNHHSPYAGLYTREFGAIKCGNTCCTKTYKRQKLRCTIDGELIGGNLGEITGKNDPKIGKNDPKIGKNDQKVGYNFPTALLRAKNKVKKNI